MKVERFGIALLLMLIIFVGCQLNSEQIDTGIKYYTVWTDVISYSEIEEKIDLEDGYYIRTEISNDEFTGWGDEYKYRWTEDEIKKYFIGRGFDDYKATKETSWLITTNHGLLLSRSGNTVYAIMK